ncbi:MAG: molybdopterin cofactor-binding domain-containing protein, partial [Candidatus Acidiferrales bacterium]
MSAHLKIPKGIEAERYELSELPEYFFATSRRDFFKFLGAGVLVVCALRGAGAQESGSARRHSDEDALPREISAWLHIGEDGGVTVFTGKVEVGQNIRASLSQAVAEELRVAVGKIKMVMGDTQITPFDMGTFGSRTTPTMNLQLRRVAAAARDVLIGLAAARWKANAADLTASTGKITDTRNHRSAEYAELVSGQQLTEVLPAEDPLIPAAHWTVA